MDGTPKQSIFVAAAAAVCTIGLAITASVGVVGEISIWLQMSPLVVYFLHTVGHSRLPEQLNQTRNWIALTVAVAVVAVGVAIL